MPATFYRWFSDRQKEVTSFGRARRSRTERSRLGLLMRHRPPPGDMLEIGPGKGTLALMAVEAGWRYRAMEASALLISQLRGLGLEVIEGWTPPILAPTESCDVVYADQVLEHMSGIDAARLFVAEAHRVLRPGGVLFVVVPDYLDGARLLLGHRLHAQLPHHRAAGAPAASTTVASKRAPGAQHRRGDRLPARDLLAAGSLLARTPGLDALSRYTGTENLLFRGPQEPLRHPRVRSGEDRGVTAP